MDAEYFRTTIAGGRGRLLQPAGLWFQPNRGWLGRNGRHRTAVQPPVFVGRKAVSREGSWGTVRRNWAQRVVQWRSDIGEHGNTSVEFGWRVGAIEIPASE